MSARKNAKSARKQKSQPAQPEVLLAPQGNQDFLTLFENLQKATPRDQNGFPAYLIDHTMIPPHYDTLPKSTQHAHLEASQIRLSMLEGYLSFDHPQQSTPTPVWSQLPHEPDSYFHALRIHLLSAHRNLAEAANHLPPGFTPYTLREAYALFHWKERARAYDILKPVAAARLRDQRVLLMEDAHFQLGHQLMQTLSNEIAFRADADPQKRPFAGLKSKELIDSLISATELQRVALRLPAKGPRPNQQDPTPYASPERAIKEATSNYEGIDDASPASSREQLRQKIDQAIARDPAAAASLQQMALDILMSTRDKGPNSSDASTSANENVDNVDDGAECANGNVGHPG